MKKHEWLSAIGTVVALVLAGISFYYQFLRTPRELSAVVLPVIWNADGTCTIRTILWNDGTRDEVVEGGYLRLDGVYRGRPEGRRVLFGPQVIRPGEAKSLTTIVRLNPQDLVKELKELGVIRTTPYALEERVLIEFHAIDRDGRLIVSASWLCNIWLRDDGQVMTPERASRMRLDLLKRNEFVIETEKLAVEN